jgi:hypothetical protein
MAHDLAGEGEGRRPGGQDPRRRLPTRTTLMQRPPWGLAGPGCAPAPATTISPMAMTQVVNNMRLLQLTNGSALP